MKLLVVIPALDEESSIESIIQRTLDARDAIVEGSMVDEVAITVVSDGSSDRTVERASAYLDDIELIVFERNRGYGAAIKTAWERSDAELLGFLDADGTCDPDLFATMCDELVRHGADVVLGDRLGPDSEMPAVRRLGNVLFSALLTAVSSQRVRDTASGMRVVRRDCLDRLGPLPDGLHFTPAMTARVLLDDQLSLVEVPMPYAERAGESKLRVGRDGARFLAAILRVAALYRPARLLGAAGALVGLVGVVLMVGPALHYVGHGEVEEWMIYRFVVGSLAAAASSLLVCSGYLTARIVDLVLVPPEPSIRDVAGRWLASRWFWVVPLGLMAAGGALVLPSAVELARTGATYEHWSRFIVMSTAWTVAVVLVATKVIDAFLDLVAERLHQLEAPAP